MVLLVPRILSLPSKTRKVKAIYLSGLLCLLRIAPARAAQLAWPCFTGGSPCHANCFTRGGLLPHLFTLTLAGGIFSAALTVKQVYGPVSPVFQPARRLMKFGSSSVTLFQRLSGNIYILPFLENTIII